jgi:hypothetical protein
VGDLLEAVGRVAEVPGEGANSLSC